jgi:formylglycine-generating enzyme required for sulfatase activity
VINGQVENFYFLKPLFVIVLSSLGVICTASAQDNSVDISTVMTMQDDKGVQMVYLPEGTFKMGITLVEAMELCPDLVPEKFVSRVCSEKVFIDFSSISEAKTVTVSPFYIDQFEVSLEAYLKCVDADVCETDFLDQEMDSVASGDDISIDAPLTKTDYNNAAIYCAWRGGRLPTEIEWEYAARGPENLNFPWGNEFDGTRANFCDESCLTAPDTRWVDGYSQKATIQTFETGQSWAGIHNLSGNVAEWTSTQQIGENGVFTDVRVIKGGSYLSFGLETAGWSRLLFLDSGVSSEIGFRCARTTPL